MMEFVDRVAAGQPQVRPAFKLFRSRLVMNGDARQMYFSGTDKVLLGYDPNHRLLAIRKVPVDVKEHADWQAFHIEPRAGAVDSYQIPCREFWDRYVGLAGGRPLVRGEEAVEVLDNETIAVRLV